MMSPTLYRCHDESHSVQVVTFVLLLATVYWAELLNRLGATHWRLFSRQQYFDSSGMFISLVLSMPLLVICLIIMVR